MNDIEAKALANGSWRNRSRIKAGMACGCFYCLAAFPSDDITLWADDGMTALCPRCGIDAVLPGVTDIVTLQDLHACRFGETFQPSAAAWDAMLAGSTPG